MLLGAAAAPSAARTAGPAAAEGAAATADGCGGVLDGARDDVKVKLGTAAAAAAPAPFATVPLSLHATVSPLHAVAVGLALPGDPARSVLLMLNDVSPQGEHATCPVLVAGGTLLQLLLLLTLRCGLAVLAHGAAAAALGQPRGSSSTPRFRTSRDTVGLCVHVDQAVIQCGVDKE